MAHITLKKWFAKKTICVKDGITLCWKETKVWKGDKAISDIDLNNKEGLEYYFDEKNWEEAEYIYGKVTRETEKAVLVEADYWYFKYCRYANDAVVKHGWKVWIPKSVICNLDDVLAEEKV